MELTFDAKTITSSQIRPTFLYASRISASCAPVLCGARFRDLELKSTSFNLTSFYASGTELAERNVKAERTSVIAVEEIELKRDDSR